MTSRLQWITRRSFGAPEPKYGNEVRRGNDGSEGYSVNYEVSGSGEHVTLVHGVGSSLRSWDPIVARLGNRSPRTLRYDTRGHGSSEKPPSPYSLNDYVGELRALLDAERVETTQGDSLASRSAG